MIERVISAPLKRPPYSANQLSSDGSVLAAWRSWEIIHGDDGVKYHFALYSSALGWQGYRWDDRYGMPIKIFPSLSNTVWVHTGADNLMRLQIGQNGEATVVSEIKSGYLFYANESNCLVAEGKSRIKRLQFDKNGRLVSSADFDILYMSDWANLLPDGAIATSALHDRALVVLSPNGQIAQIIHEEPPRNSYYCYFQPFILNHALDHLYYTEDPRQGWRKTSVPQEHLQRTGKYGTVKFFAILGDTGYAAMENSGGCLSLYRFSPESPHHIKCVWQITVDAWECGMAHHNGLICVASNTLISGCDGPYVPKNTGFVVWDTIRNTFHTDIPRVMTVNKMSLGQIPAIYIPEIWNRDTQHKQDP